MAESHATSKEAIVDTVASPRETTGQSKVPFETIRWTEEKELREKELDLQREQMRWSRWGNPAFVAIVAGLIGYLSTLYSAYTTRQQEVERQKHSETLEQTNREATLRLEREKQEGTLILEAIKTSGNGENKEVSTAANLVFLVDAGLITTITPEKLTRLRTIAGEALPSLPGPEGVEFQPSSDLTKELENELGKALKKYQEYLAGIGYTANPTSPKIGIRVDKGSKGNAYFDNEDVVLGSDLASDPAYALAEYTWQVLRQSNPEAYKILWEEHPTQLEGFAHGLKLYFVCSHFGDPHFGRTFYALSGFTPPKKGQMYLFDLKNSGSAEGVSEPHALGEIWGAAFWQVKEKGKEANADRLIFAMWNRLKLPHSAKIDANYLIQCILDTNQQLGRTIDPVTIHEAFTQRDLR